MNYSWALWNGTPNPEALDYMEGELEAIVICDGVTLTAHGVGSESWSVRHSSALQCDPAWSRFAILAHGAWL